MVVERLKNVGNVAYHLTATNVRQTSGELTAVVTVENTQLNRRHTSILSLSKTHAIEDFVRQASRSLGTSELVIADMVNWFVTEIFAEFYKLSNPLKLELTKDAQHDYIIDDFLLANSFNMLFARGGSGKSFIALAAALAVQNADTLENKLIFKPKERRNVLYIDWEGDFRTLSARYSKIVRGLELNENIRSEQIEPPFYLSMVRPLAEQIVEITKFIEEQEIGLVIIDSVGLACGAAIEEQATALAFFQAARELLVRNCTVFAITHMSKAAMTSDLKTPIGSIYFENMPRIIWQLIGEVNGDTTRTQMLIRKSNIGTLPSIGINLHFDDVLSYVTIEAADNSNLVVDDNVVADVLDALSDIPQGTTLRKLATDLGYSTAEVREALRKLEKQGKVMKNNEHQYILLSEEIPF